MNVLDVNWEAVAEVLKKYFVLRYSLSSQGKINCLLSIFL